MNDLHCYDLNGCSITHFTQWDTNQEIIIEGNFDSCSTEVHFCNKNSKKALYMKSIFINDYQIKAEIPNELLRQSCPISIYVYAINNIIADDIVVKKTGKTILSTTIPVEARPEPNDFIYEENTYVIYLVNLEKEIIALNKSIAEAEEIRVSNENSRISDEQTRKSNENTRIENEKNRKNVVNECQAATTAANSAASQAQNAALAAKEATSKANAIINGNISNNIITFEKSSSTEDVISGEPLSDLFGKISKWYDEIILLKSNMSTVLSSINTLRQDIDETITSEDINNIFSS